MTNEEQKIHDMKERYRDWLDNIFKHSEFSYEDLRDWFEDSVTDAFMYGEDNKVEEIARLQEELKDLKRDYDNLQDENSVLKEEIKELDEVITEQMKDISDLQDELEKSV